MPYCNPELYLLQEYSGYFWIFLVKDRVKIVWDKILYDQCLDFFLEFEKTSCQWEHLREGGHSLQTRSWCSRLCWRCLKRLITVLLNLNDWRQSKEVWNIEKKQEEGSYWYLGVSNFITEIERKRRIYLNRFIEKLLLDINFTKCLRQLNVFYTLLKKYLILPRDVPQSHPEMYFIALWISIIWILTKTNYRWRLTN